MRKRTTPLAALFTAIAVTLGSTFAWGQVAAQHNNTANEYQRVYERVDAKNAGPYAGGVAGRNLADDGVLTKHGVRPATDSELREATARMRTMIAPPAPSPSTASSGPVDPNAMAPGAPVGVIPCESGGDPTIVNPTNPDRPAGLFQIITSTWVANGGTEYAPTADLATPYEQSVVAARILASGGPGQWECAGA